MRYEFTNGSTRQKTLYSEPINYLLHLPASAIRLTIAVSFVSGASVGQTNFAETTYTYDNPHSTVKVRNDAPGFGNLDASLIAEATSWGLHYDPILHFHETAIHETGHSVFAAIPHEFRLAIARMFGVDSDSVADLKAGSKWQNRAVEGIAETFKEAFLPSQYRVFPNRTNRKISYKDFPRFRRLIREGLEAISAPDEPSPTGFEHTWRRKGHTITT